MSATPLYCGKVVKKTKNVSVRKPLKELDQDYAKSKKQSSVLQHINTFCQRRKGDLLFFSWREHMGDNSDPGQFIIFFRFIEKITQTFFQDM